MFASERPDLPYEIFRKVCKAILRRKMTFFEMRHRRLLLYSGEVLSRWNYLSHPPAYSFRLQALQKSQLPCLWLAFTLTVRPNLLPTIWRLISGRIVCYYRHETHGGVRQFADFQWLRITCQKIRTVPLAGLFCVSKKKKKKK